MALFHAHAPANAPLETDQNPGPRGQSAKQSEFIDDEGRYRPKGGELFIHSHFSEPPDGLESDGLDPADFDSFMDLINFITGSDDGPEAGSFIPSSDRFKLAYEGYVGRNLAVQAAKVPEEGEASYVIGEDGEVSIERADGTLVKVRDRNSAKESAKD